MVDSRYRVIEPAISKIFSIANRKKESADLSLSFTSNGQILKQSESTATRSVAIKNLFWTLLPSSLVSSMMTKVKPIKKQTASRIAIGRRKSRNPNMYMKYTLIFEKKEPKLTEPSKRP